MCAARGGRARDEFPDSSRLSPPADGPAGKLPSGEGTSRSCYRRALTGLTHSRLIRYAGLTSHQSPREEDPAVNFLTT